MGLVEAFLGDSITIMVLVVTVVLCEKRVVEELWGRFLCVHVFV